MTNAERYTKLVAGYEPGEDDNPDNLKWYARYFALKTIFLENGAVWKEVEGLVHNATSFFADGVAWDGMVKTLRHFSPEKPVKHARCYMNYGDFEPTNSAEAKEARAREFFKEQYKKAFPGKRINSKHAKAQWEKVGAKALQHAQDEFTDKMVAWNMREEKRKDAQKKFDDEHQAKVDQYERVEIIVLALEEELAATLVQEI